MTMTCEGAVVRLLMPHPLLWWGAEATATSHFGSHMKIAVVADIHLWNHSEFGGEGVAGVNRRAWAILDAVRRVNAYVQSHGVEIVVAAGDVFDGANPSPQLVGALQDAVLPRKAGEPRWVLLKGNHDTKSDTPGDHALASMGLAADVVDKPSSFEIADATAGILVPYQRGPAAEWFEPALTRACEADRDHRDLKRRLLFLHLGLRDQRSAKFLAGAPDAIDVPELRRLMQKFSIEAAFAGNWHDHRVWGAGSARQIVQVGTLAPAGWDNGGLEGWGGITVYDTADRSILNAELPGPRFVKVTPKLGEAEMRAATALGHSVFAWWEVEESLFAHAKDELARWIREGTIVSGRVTLNTETARTIATAAAVAGQGHIDSVDTVLREFTTKLALVPDGRLGYTFTAEEIADSTRGYIQRAKEAEAT